METIEARICEDNEDYYLELLIPGECACIPLTEDNPQIVKNVFNRLISLLKTTPFQFGFENVDHSLYSEIGEEYIKQLNNELQMVRSELEDYGLSDGGTGAR